MPLSAIALLAGIVVGLATGGRARHLASVRLRGWWMLVAGVALQVVADRYALGAWATATMVLGYLCLLGLAARNALLAGMGLVAMGVLANLTVVSLNGGMPVRQRAVLAAGIATPASLAQLEYGHRHHAERPGDHLSVLGDVVPIRPLHQVVSFGDLLLAVGVGNVTARALHSRGRHVRGAARADGRRLEDAPNWHSS